MNVRGGLVSAGNTLLTCPQNVGARGRPRPKASESCLDANNNDRDMVYVNVAASGHFNSSTATLSIPAGARVVRAYLYWGADLARGVANGSDTGAPAGETPGTNPRWRQVGLRVGSGSFVNVDATDPLRNGQWAGVDSWYSQPGNRPGFAYQVRANVTTEVRNGIQLTKRRGRLGAQVTSVTVADVQAGRGFNRHAGWNLLVAWESPTVAWRHVSIFDGFDFVQVQGGQQLVVGPLDFSGFETPASGNVDAHAVTWTYEGDRAIVGDYLALGQLGVTCDKLPHRSNAANPIDNFFNGSISTGGVNVTGRTPAYVNQLGYDLDTLALPEGAIPNNANGAAACLGTVGDTYFFGGIAFDVLIRAPNVHIAKSADRSEAAPGDVVTYTTTVTNPTRGPDDPLYPTPTVPATNLVVSDVLPSGLDFVDFVSNPAGACDYEPASRVIRCAVGTLGIDETFSYTYHARVSGAAQGPAANPLVNAACYLSNSEDQPDVTFTGCDEATVVVPAAAYVDLGVVKTVSADVVAPGTNLTWRVTGDQSWAGHVDRLRARGRAAGGGDLRQRYGESGAHLHHARGRRGRRGRLHGGDRLRRRERDPDDRRHGSVVDGQRRPAAERRDRRWQRERAGPRSAPEPRHHRDDRLRARPADPADAPAGPRSGRAAAAAAAAADPTVRPSGPRRDEAQAGQAGQAGSGAARRHDHLQAAGHQHRRGIGKERPGLRHAAARPAPRLGSRFPAGRQPRVHHNRQPRGAQARDADPHRPHHGDGLLLRLQPRERSGEERAACAGERRRPRDRRDPMSERRRPPSRGAALLSLRGT